MFTSWIRRRSLKKATKTRFLASNNVLSPVMLLSMMGLMVLIGLFVVQHSLAAHKPLPTAIPVQSR